MENLNVYEVEEDYTWICAKSAERAKEIYMEYMGWSEKDWVYDEGKTVCPVDELLPVLPHFLDKLIMYREDGKIWTFAEVLKETTKEGVFACNGELEPTLTKERKSFIVRNQDMTTLCHK